MRMRMFEKSLLLSVCLLFTTGQTCPSLAADKPTGPPAEIVEYAAHVGLPKRLYHWLSPAGLRQTAEMMGSGQYLVFSPLQGGPSASVLVQSLPDLGGKGALFTWSNPITGIMGMGQDELYAKPDPATGEPARLLVLKPTPGVKFAVVYTDRSSDIIPQTPDLKNIDLIFHVVWADIESPRIKFQEWVVLNPSKVESFTADPDQFRQDLEAELGKVVDPNYLYAVADCHARPALSNRPLIRHSYYEPALRALLDPAAKTGIPAAVLRPLPTE